MNFFKNIYKKLLNFRELVVKEIYIVQKEPRIYRVITIRKSLIRGNINFTFIGPSEEGDWACIETSQLLSMRLSKALNTYIDTKFNDKIIYIDFINKKRIT